MRICDVYSFDRKGSKRLTSVNLTVLYIDLTKLLSSDGDYTTKTEMRSSQEKNRLMLLQPVF
jgi:hypothetical protein